MKRLFFTVFVVLQALAFITCDAVLLNTAGDKTDDFIDVLYSEDGKTLTLYLEGSVPNTNRSRALTAELAEKGHDFYEVVFVYDADGVDGGEIVARASWQIGEPASVSGVYRNSTGVDYSNVSGHKTPTTGGGSAVLFVGRKSDGVLLAVGTLTSVDTGGTTITSATKTVGFSIAALVSGVSLHPASSSFLTAGEGGGNTDHTNIDPAHTVRSKLNLGQKEFPKYDLPSGKSIIAASYEIGVVSGATYSVYEKGIKLAATPSVKEIYPHYTLGNSTYEITTEFDTNTKVTITNNDDIGDVFENLIEFNINTLTSTGGYTSFYFSVPVYAIINAPSAGGTASITWKIQSGIGTAITHLDNGEGGGGAILLGIGTSGDIGFNIGPSPWLP